MTELERALVALGRELDFPPEPDLVAAVRARLERRPRRRRALAFAVALVVFAFGIAMAVPQARSAILDFFRIGSVSVQRVETLPAARERPLAAGLGPALTRRAAELRAHLPIRLPDLDGHQPTRYYAQPGMIATLLQYDGRSVLLAEMRDDQVSVGKKFTSQATRVEGVQLGRYGLWIEGGQHVLIWQFGPGEAKLIQTRLAGNVLIWLDGTTTYRLEGDLLKSQTLELAHEITR
jgi:hypothetical protein